MIFLRLFVPNFWIFWIFANASAQQLTSTLPASNRTCPGTRITFNCSITGSVSVSNLIIAWSSPEYIGIDSFLQFTTDNMMGDSGTSTINDDVTAQLLYNGDRNGTPTLESQLQLTVSSDSLSSTVSCNNVISGALESVTFSIPSVPGRPHDARGTEVPTVDDRCVILLTWDAPLDYDEEDIDHYFVQSSSANNVMIRINAKSTFVSVNIPRCQPGIHINVSAVDRCDRDGPSTVIVPHLDLTAVNETEPTQQVTTRQENQSGSLENAVIILGVILGFVVMFIICVCVLYIFCCCYTCRIRRKCLSELEDSELENDIAIMGMIPVHSNSHYGDVIMHQPTKHQKAVRGQKQETPLAIEYMTVQAIHPEDGWTALHRAAFNGKTDMVELFVDSCAQLDKIDKNGRTALHLASYSGHTDVVKLLLGSGAQIDNIDNDGQTALHLASISGHTDVVKLLVDSGAQIIDNKNENGLTALDFATIKDHTRVVKVLLASGAHHGRKYLSQRLLTLCEDGCTAEVGVFKSLLHQGADPDIHDTWSGYHPLWYASHYGKRVLVELFLQYKADISLKTEDGQTALHRASKSGHTDVVKLLVDSGAQIDNKDKHGRTALHLASSSGLTDVVKLLVGSRAQIDNKDKDDQTALHLASRNGYTDVVKLLVGSGAQIDNKDKYGWTALHHASHSGLADMVTLLLGSGAQIDNKNKYGQTALNCASSSDHTNVVNLLIDSGASIDSEDNPHEYEHVF